MSGHSWQAVSTVKPVEREGTLPTRASHESLNETISVLKTSQCKELILDCIIIYHALNLGLSLIEGGVTDFWRIESNWTPWYTIIPRFPEAYCRRCDKLGLLCFLTASDHIHQCAVGGLAYIDKE